MKNLTSVFAHPQKNGLFFQSPHRFYTRVSRVKKKNSCVTVHLSPPPASCTSSRKRVKQGGAAHVLPPSPSLSLDSTSFLYFLLPRCGVTRTTGVIERTLRSEENREEKIFGHESKATKTVVLLHPPPKKEKKLSLLFYTFIEPRNT